MKKLLFGIFAHPDDEAFGPSATLYRAAQHNTDVHLLLVTDGENGENPDAVANLAEVRVAEWQKCAELIGAKTTTAFHYADGGLSNNLYLEIAEKLTSQIHQILSGYTEAVSVDFMTYEHGGITGHLDHIAVSYITTYIYKKLRDDNPSNVSIGKLKYYCLPECLAPQSNTNWLYMSCGKADADCDEIFDYTNLIEKKKEIMTAHYSQRSDMKAILKQQEQTSNPCRYKDHFCYFKD